MSPNLFLLLLMQCASRLLAQEATDAISNDVDDEEDDAPGADSKLPATRHFLPPRVPDGAYYVQYFPRPGSLADHGLVASQSKKDSQVDASLFKYGGVWSVEVPANSALEGDYALVMKSQAKHYAISAKLARSFNFDRVDKQFVMQYEVKFLDSMECGGAYVKLLTEGPGLDLKIFNDKTPYTIMFGPDKCGVDQKLHFILRHRSPKTGQIEEKHAKKPTGNLATYFSDKRTHLYTLVIKTDSKFEVYVDKALVNSGSLLEDMQPPVNPPKEVDDPADKKPDDWDDCEKIPDPKVAKPVGWGKMQPEFLDDADSVMPQFRLVNKQFIVPDPKAEKPANWDDNMNGVWELPKIDNLKYKAAPGCGQWSRPNVKKPKYAGKWAPPLVLNPAYKGVWKSRRIPNPDYFVDSEPWRFDPIGAIGLELWSMSDGIAFDNLLIVDRKALADAFAEQTWVVKREAERLADSVSQSVIEAIRDLTRERPWIWSALLVGVVLPLVLLVAYCCCLRESDNSPRDAAATARRKKTDGDDDEADEFGYEEEAEEEPTVPAAGLESKANLESDEEGDAMEAGEEDSDEPPELIDLDAPTATASGQRLSRKSGQARPHCCSD